MKVRHNISIGGKSLEHEVCGESLTHWFTHDDNWAMKALPKDQFTIIPDDRWEDVTEECETRYGRNAQGVPITSLVHGWHTIFRDNGEHYRLRKVPHCDPANGGHVWGSDKWAFVVERKVTE